MYILTLKQINWNVQVTRSEGDTDAPVSFTLEAQIKKDCPRDIGALIQVRLNVYGTPIATEAGGGVSPDADTPASASSALASCGVSKATPTPSPLPPSIMSL